MAESAVTNDAGGHAGVLHKYTGNCSQSDYNSVVPPLPDFSENISALDKQQPLSDCMDTGVGGLGELAYDFDTSDTLPNNNVVSGDEGLMDCLLDGGCVSNTSLAGKVSSVSSCGLETNNSLQQQQQHSQCASYEHLSSATATDTAYRQLVVKLETPIFDHQTPDEQQQQHHYDNTEFGTPNVKTSDNSSSDSQGKSVSFSNVVDVNNGVIKKKRKTKDDSLSLGKPTTVKRQQQRVGGATRGRPPKRPLIATYHSQISGDKNTIKIRIKKAHFSSQVTSPVKKSRQRKKQKKAGASDTDGSDYDDSNKRAKNEASSQINTEMENRPESPMEQSGWAMSMPPEILHKIFEYVTNEQGALPSLVNLCKVCNLWRQVAVSSVLWENIDLSSTVKDRAKTDFTLHWLIQNRLTACQDLNLSDWKIKNIPTILEELCEYCPEIRGLNLSGWSGLTGENLKYLTSYCSKLERLDLSSVNGSNLGTKSALNASPLVSLAQTMGSRLTHLVLAHNKLAGFSQILTALSAHCPNLQLLDLSNIKTHAYNSSLLHVEKLQQGCPKLRVLRVTNSQILLAPTTLTAQMASPGFPELEELSLAGIEDDQTTSKFIDDNGIERILKSSHKLRLLDVRGCTKITDSGLVKVPAWDLEHLFLSACYVTRLNHSGLELIVQKWSHSLVEIDLAWSTATEPLDAAVMTLAEKGSESPLRVLNLCGSSVSLESVKAVLAKCPHIQSLNLQSCRALPRGIKRLYEGPAVAELRSSLENKPKTEDLDSTGSEEQAENSAEERAATTITENAAE